MADIINLNKKRKAKNRLLKEKQAAENRIKFGRTKIEKQIAHQESQRDARHLDAHELENLDNDYSQSTHITNTPKTHD